MVVIAATNDVAYNPKWLVVHEWLLFEEKKSKGLRFGQKMRLPSTKKLA